MKNPVLEINASGGRAKFWHLDTSKEQEVITVFVEIFDEFGGIDVLINIAGISGVDKPTHELTEEEWDSSW